jgi:hypothetical protein
VAKFNYAEAVEDANELIDEFGQSALLLRPTFTGPTNNPVPGPPEEHPCTLVVTDYRNQEIDGTRVQATDRKVLVARKGLAVEPLTSDKLQIGGQPYSIQNVTPLSPGGTVVMWTIQARK